MSEESKKKIEDMKGTISELKKFAFKNYHWFLLKKWLLIVGGLLIGLFVGLVVSYFVPTPSSAHFPQSKIDDIAKSVISPSITMNGLFVAFVPVISFFYIAEIKEIQKRSEEDLLEDKKQFTEAEDLKVVDSALNLVRAFWHNYRTGVLKYTRTYLIVSLVSLFSLLFLYVALDSGLFITIDIFLLISILCGIFPIISTALDRPTLKLKTHVIPARVEQTIEYEE